MITYTKRAVWLAANDEVHGPRLVEIARAHTKLALKASDQLRAWEGVEDVQGTLNEIKRLRAEREGIILQFEEVPL